MTRRVLYTSRTVKLDGQRHTESLLPCSIQVKCQSGIQAEYDLLVQPSEPLAAERLAQNLLKICSASPLKSFEQLLDESLVPSSVTISAVRLRRSSLSEELGRSALISLSNLTDDRIRRAKTGQWWVDNPQRGLANNSACYTEKPDFPAFLNEWKSLYESYSGERGMFSRVASQKQAAKNGRRDADWDFGTNPCSEIILRPYQFCNLSEVVVRPADSLKDLKRKVRVAAILGTLQATLTDFRYLRKVWKD